LTIIELPANKNKNFRKLADKTANQKFLVFNLLKTKTKIAFPTIINGIIGAKATGRSPTDKTTKLGNKPIKIALTKCVPILSVCLSGRHTSRHTNVSEEI